MCKLVLLGAAALIAASSVAYLACSKEGRQVVVGKDVRDDAGDAAGAVPLDRVDHSTWDRLLQKYVDPRLVRRRLRPDSAERAGRSCEVYAG